MRRTKIVATLGPVTSSPHSITEMVSAGMNVARMNFSHGTHTEHAERIALVRDVARQLGQSVAVLQDLQGPKIRTGALTEGKAVKLTAGQTFHLTTKEIFGDAQRVSTTYELLPHDVEANDRILLSDGLIELRVINKTDTEVTTEVIHGGALREHQGINLPEVSVSAPALTEKDVEDLYFGLEQDVDYVALSFVRSAADIHQVKEHIARAGKDVPVIAKIERPEAVNALPDILEVADCLMVARGDLGVEMQPSEVPIVQKQIIEAANRSGIPVITATQMLDSMIRNPRPTRAEASDVANAIIDGSDAVMLSGETATGDYPVDAVKMMKLIAETVEASGRRGDQGAVPRWSLPDIRSTPWAIGAAAGAIVDTIPVKAIVVFTQSGTSARIVAHFRPNVPILAFTPSEQVYRRLSLLWGVTPMRSDFVEHLDDLNAMVRGELVERGHVQPGDTIVITGGHPTYRRGSTNFLKIQEV